MFKFLKFLFKDFYLFSAAYSNNIFPDPLSKEEEELYIEKAKIHVRLILLVLLLNIFYK